MSTAQSPYHESGRIDGKAYVDDSGVLVVDILRHALRPSGQQDKYLHLLVPFTSACASVRAEYIERMNREIAANWRAQTPASRSAEWICKHDFCVLLTLPAPGVCAERSPPIHFPTDLFREIPCVISERSRSSAAALREFTAGTAANIGNDDNDEEEYSKTHQRFEIPDLLTVRMYAMKWVTNLHERGVKTPQMSSGHLTMPKTGFACRYDLTEDLPYWAFNIEELNEQTKNATRRATRHIDEKNDIIAKQQKELDEKNDIIAKQQKELDEKNDIIAKHQKEQSENHQEDLASNRAYSVALLEKYQKKLKNAAMKLDEKNDIIAKQQKHSRRIHDLIAKQQKELAEKNELISAIRKRLCPQPVAVTEELSAGDSDDDPTSKKQERKGVTFEHVQTEQVVYATTDEAVAEDTTPRTPVTDAVYTCHEYDEYDELDYDPGLADIIAYINDDDTRFSFVLPVAKTVPHIAPHDRGDVVRAHSTRTGLERTGRLAAARVAGRRSLQSRSRLRSPQTRLARLQAQRALVSLASIAE